MAILSALPFMLAMLVAACVRSPYPPPVPVGDDKSIKFPDFHDQFAVQVGETSGPYQLDGVLLRAIMIAANDFTPPNAEEQQCPFRQEAQFYRVIRQGDVIFVDVSYNPAYCAFKFFILDGGARYAISTDGRILRRLIGNEPDGFPREEPPDDGVPVPASEVGSTTSPTNWDALPPSVRLKMQDAGANPPSPIPDGGVPVPDGGSPGGPRDGGT
jgi:hypothetical protein